MRVEQTPQRNVLVYFSLPFFPLWSMTRTEATGVVRAAHHAQYPSLPQEVQQCQFHAGGAKRVGAGQRTRDGQGWPRHVPTAIDANAEHMEYTWHIHECVLHIFLVLSLRVHVAEAYRGHLGESGSVAHLQWVFVAVVILRLWNTLRAGDYHCAMVRNAYQCFQCPSGSRGGTGVDACVEWRLSISCTELIVSRV